MRVAWNSLNEPLLDRLNQLAARQGQLQLQAASGRRLTQPSDDPDAVTRVLDRTAEGAAVDQFQRNITTLKDLATAGHGVLKSLKSVSDRAGEIATLADDTRSPKDLAAFAVEVNQLLEQALQFANRKHGATPLFGGTRLGESPFVATRDAAGRVTAVTYQGSANVPEVEVSEGVTASALAPGANDTGSGPAGVLADRQRGADFFQHLIALRDHLEAGDVSAIAATDRPGLRRDEDNLVMHLARSGALQARLEVSSAQARERATALEGQVSREADADLATVLTELSASQTAYQAALHSTASLQGQSLLDFLR